MKLVGLDFETYYDKEFTLRKYTPVEYILDPRYETIGCSIKEGTSPAYWIEGPELPAYFAQADREAAYVTHNALFDMCITSFRYGFVPKLMCDTMGMSRACLGHVLRSVSLKAVAQHLELGAKGDTVHNVMGMNLAHLKASPQLYEEYKQYSNNDNELCVSIFWKLINERLFPISELAVLDMTLRAAVLPKLKLDMTVLAERLYEVRAEKAALLAQAGLQDKDALMSNEKFAIMLHNLGVEPPMKLSPITSKVTYAFAKSDPQFIELSEHEDPAVQALVGARLGHKSTIEETRLERLLKIGRCWWPETDTVPAGGNAALIPIPLNFSAAHTHRLGGAWRLNMQNLPRNTGDKQSALRRALTALPNHKIVAGDASQIEARIVAWICKQPQLLAQFANGDDVYSIFASYIFNRKITKQDTAERFIGKTGILGLGFGVGWEKFQRTVKVDSKKYTGKEINLSDVEAKAIVELYRKTKYREINNAWDTLNSIGIPALINGTPFSFGPTEFEQGAILLPSGLRLKYHDLQYKDGPMPGYEYTYGGRPKRLYGGALLENIVQAVARIITMDAGVRIQRRLKKHNVHLALQAHDELVYVCPDALVNHLTEVIAEEMSAKPHWAQDLPLKAEVNSGQSYADAK